MNDFKQVYEAISDIWGLYKKHGSARQDDAGWDRLLKEGNQLLKKYRAISSDMGQLFEDMYIALRKYYQRRETADEI